MAIRVAHIGTGNVGRLALAELIDNPAFDLTGLCVSSADKVGRDAGQLAGVNVTTGVIATDDMAAILATEPECAVYCAMGDTRLVEAMASDKKRRGGVPRLVVPHGLADVRVETGLPAERVEDAWRSVGAA